MANLFSVPNYIKAASPLGLRRLMFEVQRRDSTQYKFFNIQFSQGFWFAWYQKERMTEVEKAKEVTELLKD